MSRDFYLSYVDVLSSCAASDDIQSLAVSVLLALLSTDHCLLFSLNSFSASVMLSLLLSLSLALCLSLANSISLSRRIRINLILSFLLKSVSPPLPFLYLLFHFYH